VASFADPEAATPASGEYFISGNVNSSRGDEDMNMKSQLQALVFTAAIVVPSLLTFAAQGNKYQPSVLPPARKAARVTITQGPELESVHGSQAIIRWISNNPGGSDEHFAVAHYGTAPDRLDQTAKSHIRLNQNHATTVFRVLVLDLRPKTTYYYQVDSSDGNGTSDGVKGPTRRFTTP
jgi:hypothetical protein